MEEHFLVQKGVYITGEDLEVFGFTARCLWCMSLLRGKGETSAHRKLPKAD